MAPVKCIALHAISLPGGRLLPPGETADVDVRDDAVQALISGHLAVVVEDFDPSDHTIAEVVDWVGDDPERAAVALASERARPEADQRSTLTDKLAELVGPTDDSQED